MKERKSQGGTFCVFPQLLAAVLAPVSQSEPQGPGWPSLSLGLYLDALRVASGPLETHISEYVFAASSIVLFLAYLGSSACLRELMVGHRLHRGVTTGD